jgi:hypothetical protein
VTPRGSEKQNDLRYEPGLVEVKVNKAIEILYFEGCPHWREALDRVRELVVQAGLEGTVSIQAVPVETEEQAERVRFLGSPSLRVDGCDIEPATQSRTDFGLQCRVYEQDGRKTRLPAADLILSALGAVRQ